MTVMIKQFRNGKKIEYKYNRAGEASLSVSSNISGYIFTGPMANQLKNYMTDLVHLNLSVGVLSANCMNGCQRLTSVNLISTNVSSVGQNCFSNCPNLQTVFTSYKQ